MPYPTLQPQAEPSPPPAPPAPEPHSSKTTQPRTPHFPARTPPTPQASPGTPNILYKNPPRSAAARPRYAPSPTPAADASRASKNRTQYPAHHRHTPWPMSPAHARSHTAERSTNGSAAESAPAVSSPRSASTNAAYSLSPPTRSKATKATAIHLRQLHS